MAAAESFDLPPEEAIRHFRAKADHYGFSWLDTDASTHVRSFTVAKIMQADILSDVRAAMDAAMPSGDWRTFYNELRPVLEKKGWWGVKEMVDPKTGKTVQVQLGSARRLRIIFDTNLRTSLAYGRWQRIERVREAMPWLRYVAVRDARTRPEHLAWHGTVLTADDPWWDSHFPPNGWNCRCTVQQLSDEGLQRYGYTPSRDAPPSPVRTWRNRRTGVTYQVPRGIDPGFQHNVGKLRGYPNPGNAGVPPIIPPSRARDLGAAVKSHPDPAQSYGEAAANRIYHELGIRAPDSFLVEQPTGLGVANVTLPHQGPVAGSLTPAAARNVLRGFVADVWLGNRMTPDLDAIRLIDADTAESIRIDQAGSLLFHPDGRRKTPAERNEIGEWYDLANPDRSPGYARVFKAAGLSLPEDLGLDAIRQIAAIRQLRSRSRDFEDLAPAVPGLPAADRRQVLEMLRRRHDLLEQKTPGIYLTLEPSVADAALRHEMGGFFQAALNDAKNALSKGVNLHGMSAAELVRLHLYTLRKGVPDQWTCRALNQHLRSRDPAARGAPGDLRPPVVPGRPRFRARGLGP